MKIVFIYSDPKKKLSAWLTMRFTNSPVYHVGFTNGRHFWDMNLIRRRRLWDGLYPPAHVRLADCPVEISAEYLDHRLDTDDSTYGWKDYILFALRPVYHLFGKSTRNAGGVICSELVYSDLNACGWSVRFAEVPSPADLERVLIKQQ